MASPPPSSGRREIIRDSITGEDLAAPKLKFLGCSYLYTVSVFLASIVFLIAVVLYKVEERHM